MSAATEQFRVTGVSITYKEPRLVDVGGKEEEQMISTHASRGEVVDLVPREAARLQELGTVKSVGAPLGYDELNFEQLKALAHQRGVVVQGSGANGEAIEPDYINALRNADIGATLASTSPGGAVRTAAGQSEGVYVDAPQPADEETIGAPRRTRKKADQPDEG